MLAINDYYELGYKIYYWRTQSDIEVDFVIYGPKGFHAFEIKRSNRVSKDVLSGLNEFKKDYPSARLHLGYAGKLKEYHNGITAWPFVELLKKLPQIISSIE